MNQIKMRYVQILHIPLNTGGLLDKTQTRKIDYYNLDMIISVGYRVKSKNAIIFRNQNIVKKIDIKGRPDTELKGTEAQKIIKVINNYSNTLNLLDDYNHKKITKPTGTKNNKKKRD